MARETLLGFDIGGTKCAAVLGQADGDGVTILGRASFPTPKNDPAAVLARLEEEARRLAEARGVPLTAVRALGIASGGPLDAGRGVVLGPPNLPGWDEVPVAAHFRKALGIPAFLQNDANACALAEWRWGAGRGCRHLVFLTFGTGMGAGLILNGRLYEGASGLAGEVGHVRLAEDGPEGYGKRGSFEGFCSGGGLAAAARDLAKGAAAFDPADVTARALADAAAAGDPVAAAAFRTSARYLGRGLAVLVDLLNPERIVLGGVFARRPDLFRPIAERVLAEEAIPASLAACRVVPAELGEAIGDYACLGVAMEGARARAGRP